ncbi:MAG: BtrH N-terminal domain-containing protein, partial [Chloroflexi bacterium]|nr:BtrH N-terminal domain-containing protein [Chloroflexota bacterium]
MTVLTGYDTFDGLHWETGTICNALAYQGVQAPHTGEPYTEALLLGVSGGAMMGYFTFSYEGYDPQARIMTRHTFDPMPTLLSRLGVVQHDEQTGSAKKARENLQAALEAGLPAIVWADMWSLPYNALEFDESWWAMLPILVYGLADGQAHIADRARVPLHVSEDTLAAARARTKKAKHRLITIEPPNPEKLAAAVQLGIWDCIKLYTEAPPKGSAKNFGLAAFTTWADGLVKASGRSSWEKVFPPGRPMLAGLSSAFSDVMIFGKDGQAERDRYADFLDEAAIILERPGLREAAQHFRESGQAWDRLAYTLLPDSVPALAEMRDLMLANHRAFLAEG